MIAAPPRAATSPRTRFDLPEERAARVPPEARGLARDEVRLLVAGVRGVEHARFRSLPRFLRPGDLLVVNTSRTLAAAVGGVRTDDRPVMVHFSTRLDDGTWAVELRPPGRATGPVRDAEPGEEVRLPGGGVLRLIDPWPASRPATLESGPELHVPAEPPRLWRARIRAGRAVSDLLATHGRPIAYAYVEGRWPLAAYQTVFARDPGSAEMPSAGRPFSHRLVTELVTAGIGFAPLRLHTGVSSLEAGEAPLPEPFRVPPSTAARVTATRAAGGRVIAVGTTAARALESVADPDGALRGAEGWTDLVLGPERAPRVLDGIITGWHTPGASHLSILEALAGEEVVARAYAEAGAAGYLWHEFGDACLIVGS